jgi:hypothetical protein
MTDYTTASDSDLDAAYHAAYSAGQSQVYTAIAVEIGGRQASVSGFVQALTGTHFPLYEAIQASNGQFVSTDAARTAVIDSAGRVVTDIKNIGSGFMLVALVLGIAFIMWEVKK